MADHIIPYSLPEGDRAFKRKALISLFLEEEAGSGLRGKCFPVSI